MLSPTLVTDLVPAITYLGQIANDTDARNLTERTAALSTDKQDITTADAKYQTITQASTSLTSVNASLTNLQTADTNILSTLSAKLDTTTHATSVTSLQTQMTTNHAFTDARFSVLDGGHADPSLAPERGRVGLLEDRVTVVEAADNTATVTQLQTDLDAVEVLIGQASNTTKSR